MSCSKRTSELFTQDEDQQNIISYETKGSGEAVVLIHAGGLDKQMWASQLKSLSKDFKVIAYDVRGHGQTKTIDNRLPEIADLNAVLRSEGVSRINLVGCSLGAIIALDYAISRPEIVQKLVLVSPGLIGHQENHKEFIAIMTQYAGAMQAKETDQMVQILKQLTATGKKNRVLEEELDSYITSSLNTFIESGSYARVPQIKEARPTSKLEDVQHEVLILHGSEDYDYIADNALELKKKLPNATKIEIKGAGHLVNLDKPQEFDDYVRDFIKY